ncbi:cytochrome c551 [Sediminibacillus massiliensis]|uniref:cytochrome c551 n=1 Tax=Sediminibacillus massiliensis TaxID=1926277 RepID=UPI00098870BB|nr:cytochrome c [Sediminibacillus massiliensis]
MKKLLMTAIFGTVLVLSACGGNDEENADNENNDTATEEPAENEAPADENENAGDEGGGGTVDTAAAEEAYQQSCQSCHGADLSGQVGPSLQAVGSEYSREEILEIIQNGKGSMPGGQATGEDAEMIASWLAEKK